MSSQSEKEKLRILRAFQSSEGAIRAWLRRFVNGEHEIDDICQETMARALDAIRSREVEQPSAFLFGIARNLVRKALDRKSKSLIDFVSDFSPDDYRSEAPSAEQSLSDRQQLLMFAEAVATLPGQCQRVFLLKKVHGYSHKEIAAMLQISVSTVEKHVAAGLKRCLDEMEKRENARAPAASGKKRGAPGS